MQYPGLCLLSLCIHNERRPSGPPPPPPPPPPKKKKKKFFFVFIYNYIADPLSKLQSNQDISIVFNSATGFLEFNKMQEVHHETIILMVIYLLMRVLCFFIRFSALLDSEFMANLIFVPVFREEEAHNI